MTKLSETKLRDLAAKAAIRKPSLEDDAYRALKEAIRDNLFPPGYQGSELEIALRLGMSRTPVHNAVIRLQEDGLVRILPRRGVVVCAISPEDMREIYDVIIAFESRAAELLAALPSQARTPVADELDRLNTTMAEALQHDDLAAWAKADDQFHRVLVERCGNGRLARIAHTIMDQAHRARLLTLKLRPKPTLSVAEHRAIAKAIRSGNVAQAHAHAHAHRTRARKQLMPLLAQFGMKHL
jgi:DNA-binding GntR family transcriptional regulator